MEDVVMNDYGEPATHDDCIEVSTGNCSGEMVYYESMTGMVMLRCAYHADIAVQRQQKISRDYGIRTIN